MPEARVLTDQPDARFLPILGEMRDTLRVEFPKITAGVGSITTGNDRESHDHHWHLECSWPQDAPEGPEGIVLALRVRKIEPAPAILADITWDPSGRVEAESSPEPVPVAEASLAEIERKLPGLFDLFRAALRRRNSSAPS